MAILNKPMINGIKVELAQNMREIQFCQLYGKNGTLIAKGNHLPDTKMGDQDGAEGDVMGLNGRRRVIRKAF